MSSIKKIALSLSGSGMLFVFCLKHGAYVVFIRVKRGVESRIIIAQNDKMRRVARFGNNGVKLRPKVFLSGLILRGVLNCTRSIS